MNCQSHLYRGLNRTEITRRWFFQQCGVGLGAIALGTLFGFLGMLLATPLAAAFLVLVRRDYVEGVLERRHEARSPA